jgi:hypothetical protein
VQSSGVEGIAVEGSNNLLEAMYVERIEVGRRYF